jgi:hypothetical protein
MVLAHDLRLTMLHRLLRGFSLGPGVDRFSVKAPVWPG